MSAESTSMILTEEWQLFADGSETATIQTIPGSAQMTCSASPPGIGAAVHILPEWFTITPPDIAWVRYSGSGSTKATITK